METKTCKTCKEVKPLDNFERLSSVSEATRGDCRPCHNKSVTAKRAERRKADQAASGWVSTRANAETLARTETTQRCSGCKEDKLYAEFPIDRTSPVGRGSKCLACKAQAHKERHASAPEHYRAKGREAARTWWLAHRPDDWEPARQWRKDDKGRECIICEQYKVWDSFYRYTDNSASSVCKDCLAWRNMLARHGLTQQQYEWLLYQQNGVCDLCCGVETRTHYKSGELFRLSVDHWHGCANGCGKKKSCAECVRGLLCKRCNSLIEWVEHVPVLAQRFDDYLVRRPLLGLHS